MSYVWFCKYLLTQMSLSVVLTEISKWKIQIQLKSSRKPLMLGLLQVLWIKIKIGFETSFTIFFEDHTFQAAGALNY